MTISLRPRPKYVMGPDGSPLTIADLPPPGTERWVIRRKAEVIAAVRGGLLSLEEACSRYMLTVAELLVNVVGWPKSENGSFATEPTRAKIQQCLLLSESDHPVVDERGQRVVRRLPHRLKTFAHSRFAFLDDRRRVASQLPIQPRAKACRLRPHDGGPLRP